MPVWLNPEMLRHVMHLIEEELKRHNSTIPSKRLYGEALCIVSAFTFYNGVSPYNAHTGRQPPFLPDLENIDSQGKVSSQTDFGNSESEKQELRQFPSLQLL